MTDTPHFALPFRIVNGSAAVNEQDSPADVVACVEAVLRTRPGQRDEHPEFGTPDLTFRQLPTDLDAYVEAIEEFEPRARVLAEDDPTLFHEAVLRVRLTLSTED